jgi:hypothetical protein
MPKTAQLLEGHKEDEMKLKASEEHFPTTFLC